MILDEHNIMGKLDYTTACEFMHYHLDIGEKSSVRQPEVLLEKIALN